MTKPGTGPEAHPSGPGTGAALGRVRAVVVYCAGPGSAVGFYSGLGFSEAWRSERREGDRRHTRVGLGPAGGGPQLVLHDDARSQATDVELEVADVRAAYRRLSLDPRVSWLRTPFETERGWSAVLRAPDRNVWVLVEAAPALSPPAGP